MYMEVCGNGYSQNIVTTSLFMTLLLPTYLVSRFSTLVDKCSTNLLWNISSKTKYYCKYFPQIIDINQTLKKIPQILIIFQKPDQSAILNVYFYLLLYIIINRCASEQNLLVLKCPSQGNDKTFGSSFSEFKRTFFGRLKWSPLLVCIVNEWQQQYRKSSSKAVFIGEDEVISIAFGK